MKEEKGGVIHIIFFFIGVACLSLGAFMFFTDEKIDLKEDPGYINKSDDEDIKEDKDIINQISFIKNVETTVTLKDGSEAKIEFIYSEESNHGRFNYNGKNSFETTELEQCDKYFQYNNSIISYCVYGSATSGHLYIVDSDGEAIEVKTFKDQEYSFIPENIIIKDGKLVINGIRVSEGAVLNIGDTTVNLCNEEEVKSNNVSLSSPALADYELKIVDNKPVYTLINTTKTIQEFINESCKIVE